MVVSAEGRGCTIPGLALLGEACDGGCYLEGEQYCPEESGRCECREGLREATDEEIRASFWSELQCRPLAYSLGEPVGGHFFSLPSFTVLPSGKECVEQTDLMIHYLIKK